jgi:hypothetical protein
MTRICDQCGHEVPTSGGEGRFAVHDLDGNAQVPFTARQLAGEKCPGSLLHPVDENPGQSVRTTSAGLPGHGKRR